MSPNDPNTRPETQDESDALSATGMFLSAFDSKSEPAKQPDWMNEPSKPVQQPAQQSAPPAHPPASVNPAAVRPVAPGEFTQMFQAMNQNASPAARPTAMPSPQEPVRLIPAEPIQPPFTPAPPPPVHLGTKPPSAAAPGEFTRIFVADAPPPAELASRPAPEIPQAASTPSNPSRNKGFSSPGASDSAEGSFTQLFKAAPPAPPVSHAAQPFTPQAPPPLPPKEQAWPPDPPFLATPPQFHQPAAAQHAPEPLPHSPAHFSEPSSDLSSATGMLSSMGSPSFAAAAPSTAPHSPEPIPYQAPHFAQPAASYSATPVPVHSSTAEPSGMESGSVTRLIQRLSQVAPEPPPEAYTPPAPPATPSHAEPGAFTRMISGDLVKAAINQPATAPAANAPPAAAVPLPPVAIPHAAITPPAVQVSVAAPVPHAAPASAFKVEAPHFAAPKLPQLAPPALAAPQAKLPAMIPILLVVNTFLLVLLLVVVIFAMKR